MFVITLSYCSHGDVNGPHAGHVDCAVAEGDEVQEGHLGSEPAIVTFPISPNLVKCLPLERNEYKKSPWDRFPFVPSNFASVENTK